MSKNSDKEKKSNDDLIEALRASTSNELEDLESVKIDSETVLHFSIKKETLLKKMSNKITGKYQNLQKEQKLTAEESVLEKGVWIEIDVDDSYFWIFLEARSVDGPLGGAIEYSCVFYPDKNDTSEVIGSCIKHLDGFTECNIFLPRMQFVLKHSGNGMWNISANCVNTVVAKPSQGLVCLLKGSIDGVEAESPKLFIYFDDSGKKFIENKTESGKDSARDARIECRTEDFPVSFYRGGSEPFVCFDVQKTPYTKEER